MSIKETQVLDRDSLNRGFVSKGASGTQIMAGSLRLLGGVTIDGTTKLGTTTTGSLTTGSISSGAINAGASNITTTGTVSAGTLSGSLAASNLTGTIDDARLGSTVMQTDVTQTITADKTMNAALYFANGANYYVGLSGNAVLNALTLADTLTVNGNQINLTSTAASNKIRLTGADSHVIGTESYHNRYGPDTGYSSSIGHKFYRGGGEVIAQFGFGGSGETSDRLDSRFSGNLSVAKDLEVEGEIKHSTFNEFPDPLLVSEGVGKWDISNGTIVFDSTQSPVGTGANGAIKITASAADAYSYCTYEFDVSPNEWITFSAYAFCTTTAKSSQYYIQWLDASKGVLTHSSTAITDTATSWTRYSVAAQAPSTARYFKVRVDNDGGLDTVMYFSAFQVERGKAMTGFKPYAGGGAGASFFSSHLYLPKNGEIHSGHNNDYLIKDHGNGNVTLSAAGNNLYLGYQNTGNVLVFSNLVGNDGTTKIADTEAKLYYQGNDIDGRYLHLANASAMTVSTETTFSGGTTISGSLTMSGTVEATGGLDVNTATNTKPFVVSRTGTDNQAIKMGVDDTVAYYHYINDETASYIRFTMENTDVANSGLSASTNTPMSLYSSNASYGVTIGSTSAPDRLLHVTGDARINTTLEVGAGTAASDLMVTSGGSFNFRNVLWSDGTNVAIGQTSATEKLDVSGNVKVSQNTYVDGKIGVGTNSPNSKLHLYEANISPTLLTLHNYTADIARGHGNFIEFMMTDDNATFTPQAKIGMVIDDRAGDSGIATEGKGNFVILTGDAGTASDGTGTLSEKMRVSYDGHVGIGTSAPANLLHVQESGEGVALLVENATSNGTVAQFTATGDNTTMSLQPDHIFSSTTLHLGNESSSTYLRGIGIAIGKTSVTSGYDVDIDGNTQIDGNADITGNANIAGTASITGNADIQGNQAKLGGRFAFEYNSSQDALEIKVVN